MPNFNGMWTSRQQLQARGANIWPATPGAPTSVTATNAGATSISVAFTAPADTGYPANAITSYTVTSSPGGITATGSSSPVVVTGLTTGQAYTFTVTATNATGTGPASAASNSATPAPLSGQQAYTSAGSYSFVVPAGVTQVSAMAVGGGGGGAGDSGGLGGSPGGGGGLVYSNTWSVTPGETLTVTVGGGGAGGPGSSGSTSPGGTSSIYRGGTLLIAAYGGDAGPNPGSANGGTGTYTVGTGTVIQGGGKGSGEDQSGQPCGSSPRAGINGYFGDPGGGGTAIVSGLTGNNGGNVSGSTGGNGGAYGGGGGTGNGGGGGSGAAGAVRFAWGTGRTYPSNAPNV